MTKIRVSAAIATAMAILAITPLLVSTAALALPEPVPGLKTWFREKYVQQTYDDYYHYTLTRYEFGDNDRDVCPDFHKSASIFAITGQQIYRITKTCSSLYVQKEIAKSANYTPHPAHYIQLIDITVMDVVRFLSEFACYTFEIGMFILSIILLCCSTILIGIGLLCS
jgi:hypothetical protein